MLRKIFSFIITTTIFVNSFIAPAYAAEEEIINEIVEDYVVNSEESITAFPESVDRQTTDSEISIESKEDLNESVSGVYLEEPEADDIENVQEFDGSEELIEEENSLLEDAMISEEMDVNGESFSCSGTDVVNHAREYLSWTKGDFGFTYDWCVAFVDWVLSDFDINIGSSKRVTDFIQEGLYYDRGTFYYFYTGEVDVTYNSVEVGRGDFEPRPGDLVCFTWSGDPDERFDHIGIVTECSGGRISFIDGNSSAGGYTNVVEHDSKYAIGSGVITGYFRPNYNDVHHGRPPYGCIDTCEGGNGTVEISIWHLDPDHKGDPEETHVYIDDEGHDLGYTDWERDDVNISESATGKHGCRRVITTSKRGWVNVQIWAIGIDDGNTLLGVERVYVNDPIPYSIKYNKSSISLKEGGKETVRVSWSGSDLGQVAQWDVNDADKEIISFEWGEINVVAGYADLIITGKKAGSLNLTTVLQDSNLNVKSRATLAITVTAPTYSLDIPSTTARIAVDGSQDIACSFSTDRISDIKYELSDTSALKASWISKNISSGKATLRITGLKDSGSSYCYIKLLKSDGSVAVTKYVYITLYDDTVYSLSSGVSSVTVTEGESETVSLSFSIKRISDLKVYSANTGIATAVLTKNLQTGIGTVKVTGVNPGSTYITAVLYKKDGSQAKSIKIPVTVKEKPVKYSITADNTFFRLQEGESVTSNVSFSTDRIGQIVVNERTGFVRCTWDRLDKQSGKGTLRITGVKAYKGAFSLDLYNDTNTKVVASVLMSGVVSEKVVDDKTSSSSSSTKPADTSSSTKPIDSSSSTMKDSTSTSSKPVETSSSAQNPTPVTDADKDDASSSHKPVIVTDDDQGEVKDTTSSSSKPVIDESDISDESVDDMNMSDVQKKAILAQAAGLASTQDTITYRDLHNASENEVITLMRGMRFSLSGVRKSFISSNKKVASVSSKGLVKLKRPGSSRIEYISASGVRRTLRINVVDSKISKATVYEGQTFDIRTSLPLTATIHSSGNDIVGDLKLYIAEDGNIHLSGEAYNRGNSSVAYSVNGLSYTFKIKVK